MTQAHFVLSMAWREARASGRRLLLLMGAVTVGVGALVAINSFTWNLRDSARGQAQAILGADVVATGRGNFSDRARALFDSVSCSGVRPCAQVAGVTSFAAMAYVPRTVGARLTQASAVAGSYPFYGEFKTEPASGWKDLPSGPHVLVEPSLLSSLEARVGDSLMLGNMRFVISGVVTGIPGDVSTRAAFGPRVFFPAEYLDSTGLITVGSLARYQAYLKLAPNADQPAAANRLRDALAGERITVRTVDEDQQDLDEALQQMGRYLGLVALVALLLGGLGVASAVHVFIRRKLETIAILRCLGASGAQVLSVYLVQALAMGLAGSVAGAALGIGFQLALPAVFAGLLPVDVKLAVSGSAIAMGIATGLWVSGVFALLPLLAVRRISPLVVLRRDYDDPAQGRHGRGRHGRGRRGRGRHGRPLRGWPVYLLLAASIVGLAALQVGSLVSGLAFAAAIGMVLGILALWAFLLVRAVRRWFPHGLPYLWRQGLANLYRPANQTTMVVLALGFGAFLLSTLYLVQTNLLARFKLDATGARPNVVLWDIQPDQEDPIRRLLQDSGYAPTPMVPIVPMRIASVKGQLVSELLGDSTLVDDEGQPLGRWAFRREYRSTYRDTTVGSEKLVVGDWWNGPAVRRSGGPADSVVPISMEVDLAGELGVTIGDTIVWDIQGVEIPSRILNLRQVNWVRFEPNFFVVFPSGTLERAPQSFVTLARVPDPAARGRLQRQVAERYSNVTTLDLTQLLESVEKIVDRVILVVRFMALFSLAAGAVVLIGAVATSRLQRIREGVLLKTLGATRDQILRIVFVEYLCLGLLAVAMAVSLSAGAGWLLMHFVFDLRFSFPFAPLAGLATAVFGLTVGVGLWTSREIFRKTPLELLRVE